MFLWCLEAVRLSPSTLQAPVTQPTKRDTLYSFLCSTCTGAGQIDVGHTEIDYIFWRSTLCCFRVCGNTLCPSTSWLRMHVVCALGFSKYAIQPSQRLSSFNRGQSGVNFASGPFPCRDDALKVIPGTSTQYSFSLYSKGLTISRQERSSR